MIIYELMQGTKSSEEVNLLSVLAALDYIEMTPDLWTKAGSMSAGLRAKGITLPMSDLLIGAIALERRLKVLTVDTHFESISGIKLHYHI